MNQPTAEQVAPALRRAVPAEERIRTVNGSACCVEVRGGANDPAVLLVGSSIPSWPDDLCTRLMAGGHRVIRLVRRAPRGPGERRWDPSDPDPGMLAGVDAVVIEVVAQRRGVTEA